MGIPVSLLNDFERIPRDRAAVLLMRHSARFPIIPPDDGYLVGLTEEGVKMAEEFGALVGQRRTSGRLRSSPVGRCLATVQAVARGAGWNEPALMEDRLSHPFMGQVWDMVVEGRLNGVLHERVQVTLRFLLDSLPDKAQTPYVLPRLDVMVTHDTVVAAIVASLMHAPVTGPHLPGYLEGIFLWRDGKQVFGSWRGETRMVLESDALEG